MTIAQLAKVTGLSRPTVDTVLASLVETGLAHIADQSVGGGREAGRPAKLFSFVGSAGHVAGIDVGGHVVRVALADLSGAVVDARSAELDPDRDGADALEAIYALLDTALEANGARSSLRSIAIGVSGMVGPDGRVSLSYALPAWNAVDVAAHLKLRYDAEVALENDARLASMGEHHIGASILANDVLYLQVGHRLSFSLLVGGRVLRGRHHASGESGYLLFDRVPIDRASNIIWSTAGSAEEVVALSLAGDKAATAELLGFIEALAPGIAALALTVDPDLIVVGGGLSRAADVVIPALQQAVNARIRVPAAPTIAASHLGTEAVVVGSLIRAYELAAVHVFGTASVPAPELALDLLPALRSAAPSAF